MLEVELVLFELLLKESEVFLIECGFLFGGWIWVEEHISKELIVIGLEDNDLGDYKFLDTDLFLLLKIE